MLNRTGPWDLGACVLACSFLLQVKRSCFALVHTQRQEPSYGTNCLHALLQVCIAGWLIYLSPYDYLLTLLADFLYTSGTVDSF